MKKVKKLFIRVLSLTIAFLFVLGTTTGCDDDVSGVELITANTKYETTQKGKPLPVYNLTYDALGGENVMPLGISWGPTDLNKESINGVEIPDFVDDKYYDLFSKAGINYVAWAINQKWNFNKLEIIEALELCEKYGMGMYVADDYLMKTPKSEDEMRARLAEYKDYPAFLGLYGEDEPTVKRFADFTVINETYSKVIDADKYPGYYNLFPNYATGTQLSGDENPIEYEEYVRRFADTGVKVLGYDYYPFSYKDQGTTDNINNKIFTNLSIVKKVANEYQIPYRVLLQAGGQWEGNIFQPSDPYFPNEGETLWNINSTLAYGVKIIGYFCGIQPFEFSRTDTGEDYNRNSMIGTAGNINQWYYYIQKANKQIQAAAPVLLHSANVGIVATADTAAKIPEIDRLSLPWRQLTGVIGVNASNSKSVAEGVMVGCFDYKGGTALYVVNCSSLEKQKITLKFDKKYGMDVVQRAVSVGVAAKELTLTVEKGEGVLVALR